jgi:hypothetical protein
MHWQELHFRGYTRIYADFKTGKRNPLNLRESVVARLLPGCARSASLRASSAGAFAVSAVLLYSHGVYWEVCRGVCRNICRNPRTLGLLYYSFAMEPNSPIVRNYV